ncbi:MAG: hypothetical protein QXI12_13510, partial [Candidatus Methanomethyliaceae archaeon]
MGKMSVKVWGVKVGEIERTLYGHFIEHLGRCVYGGVISKISGSHKQLLFHTNVINAVQKIRCPILRWPGGNFASAYHWMDGVGPIGERPQHINYIWGGFEPNRFGTDEFLE